MSAREGEKEREPDVFNGKLLVWVIGAIAEIPIGR